VAEVDLPKLVLSKLGDITAADGCDAYALLSQGLSDNAEGQRLLLHLLVPPLQFSQHGENKGLKRFTSIRQFKFADTPAVSVQSSIGFYRFIRLKDQSSRFIPKGSDTASEGHSRSKPVNPSVAHRVEQSDATPVFKPFADFPERTQTK
jgi:hypothetical protein